MNKIQMVDLSRQYLKIKEEIDSEISKVITTSTYINGPIVGEFADNLSNYLNAKHVIPCANGTDALQVALMALDLKKGDEVIVPSFTFVATVEVIVLLGLIPVFVDVDKDTFTMNVESIKSMITDKTKVIIPVHLYGQCCNMSEIMNIANQHNIIVIEDNAQSIGGSYLGYNGDKKTGTIGAISCISFFPSKNLGAYGDAGAIVTNDDELAVRMKKICNHGSEKRYYHDIVGINSRLDSIQAAVLNVKLKYLDDYCNKRREIASFYTNAFSNESSIQTPFIPEYSHHVFHQYTIVLENIDRDLVHQELAKKGISSMIYYPIACHNQKMFQQFKDREYELSNTEYLTNRVLSLPIDSELTIEELQYITESVLAIIQQFKNK
ncbi:DegT/DnrJ/EryC1/StrS family aminotransferase [Myroides injenensis]|uniref:DegT/DnrJ/EryC1/StrS family aminotransferase n=1 Tax=Myroides injenensis TaxID=1183151 RepID=UPI000288A23C|nr:DegT/DnrJ/EryC1/StrS family aminotransferase [Myroides injenensis]